MGKPKNFYSISLILIFFFSLLFYLPKASLVKAGDGCCGASAHCNTGCVAPDCINDGICVPDSSPPTSVPPTSSPCGGCGACVNGRQECRFPCATGCCGGMYDCDNGGGGGTSYVTVSGTVKNKATNTGIQGVSVYIVNSDGVNESVTTGADGKYTSSTNKFPNTRDYAIRIPSLPTGYNNPKTTATTAANSCIGGTNQPVGSSSYECQKVSAGCGQSCNFTLDAINGSSSSAGSIARITCSMTATGLKSQGVKTYDGKQYRQYWVVQGKNYENALKIEAKVDNVSQATTLTYWRHPIGRSDRPKDSCWYGKPNNTGECAAELIFPAATKSQAEVRSLTTKVDLTVLPGTQLGKNVVVCNATIPGQKACSGNPFGNYTTSGFQDCNTTENPADSRVMLNVVCNKKDQGNADCNNVVNDADYDRWKCEYSNNYHSCTAAGSIDSADFDGDGYAYLLDFEIWRQNKFGGADSNP